MFIRMKIVCYGFREGKTEIDNKCNEAKGNDCRRYDTESDTQKTPVQKYRIRKDQNAFLFV
jgi:hypothetical protein